MRERYEEKRILSRKYGSSPYCHSILAYVTTSHLDCTKANSSPVQVPKRFSANKSASIRRKVKFNLLWHQCFPQDKIQFQVHQRKTSSTHFCRGKHPPLTYQEMMKIKKAHQVQSFDRQIRQSGYGHQDEHFSQRGQFLPLPEKRVCEGSRRQN